MKVILLQSIRGIGKAGDCKNVQDGYAKNFLIPKSLARPASPSVQREVAERIAHTQYAEEMHQSERDNILAALAGSTISLQGKANEKGTLFAGIEAADIVSAIERTHGIRLMPKSIQLEEHLKTIGTHRIAIVLGSQRIELNVTIEQR